MGKEMTIQAEIVSKVHELQPLSASSSELVALMGKPDHDLRSIIRIVECDAALTARVLRVANSAVFATAEPVTSISRAVSYLGEKVILAIALDVCMGSVLRRPLEGYEGRSNGLWEHNLRTALGAREVARLARHHINADVAFTGGILHDIGKAVLSEFLDGSAPEIIARIDARRTADYVSAEREITGTDHCAVGYEIARFWNLASPLPEIIRFHHFPAKSREEVKRLVYAVHLGDIMAMMAGAGTGSDDFKYSFDSGFSDYFEISHKEVEKMMCDVELEFQKTKSSILGNGEAAQ
jgi:putative nucleotidyltransferase with HDIG domain